MKYFVKPDGTNCRGYNQKPEDSGLVEVPRPPADARQVWDFGTNDYLPAPEKSQAEKDLEMLEKGVVILAELTIELIDGLIAATAINPANFGTKARQNYQTIKAAVDRRKQG